MARVLIASDDQDLSFARLQEMIDDKDLSDMSEALPSDDTQAELVESGLQVALTNLATVADDLQHRARLGLYVDAIVLLTIRPYKNRANLLYKAANTVRNLRDSVCFRNGVRAKVLPIVLIDLITLLTGKLPDTKDYDEISRLPWCYIQPPGGTLGQAVSKAIRDWRTELFLELDYVGYAITYNELGQIEVDHLLRRKRRESVFLDDSTTPENLRSSGYLRLHQDLLTEFAPYQKLRFVLNKVRNLPAKEQEPVLQACLDENPILIYRDQFEKHWSQPVLRHPDPLRRDIVPDFVLQPKQELQQAAWEVLEIKTSEQSIASRGRFTEFFLKALEQLQLHYSGYFQSPRTAAEQLQKLGHVLNKPKMALLIGRKPVDEDAEVLERAKRESEWNNIDIISYDDLFEVGMRKLDLNRTMLPSQQDL